MGRDPAAPRSRSGARQRRRELASRRSCAWCRRACRLRFSFSRAEALPEDAAEEEEEELSAALHAHFAVPRLVQVGDVFTARAPRTVRAPCSFDPPPQREAHTFIVQSIQGPKTGGGDEDDDYDDYDDEGAGAGEAATAPTTRRTTSADAAAGRR